MREDTQDREEGKFAETLVLETDSLEGAVEEAAREWDILPSDVETRILEEGKKFLGLFSRKTRVELHPAGDLDVLRARRVLSEILGLMDMSVEIEVREDATLNLTGEDSGIVIGKYGETLKSLETLLNLALRDRTAGRMIRLDSDGYRERREASLERVALASAKEAVRRHRPITLEPMSSWERRVVHVALKDYSEVETRSVGDEPQRRVVVWPRRSARNAGN